MGNSENFEIEILTVQYLGRISQAIVNARQQGLEYFMQVALTYIQATIAEDMEDLYEEDYPVHGGARIALQARER